MLTDIILYPIRVVECALAMNENSWKQGNAMTIHSSQGLTISETVILSNDLTYFILHCLEILIISVKLIQNSSIQKHLIASI